MWLCAQCKQPVGETSARLPVFYEEINENVWDEMLAVLRRHGLRNQGFRGLRGCWLAVLFQSVTEGNPLCKIDASPLSGIKLRDLK